MLRSLKIIIKPAASTKKLHIIVFISVVSVCGHGINYKCVAEKNVSDLYFLKQNIAISEIIKKDPAIGGIPFAAESGFADSASIWNGFRQINIIQK